MRFEIDGQDSRYLVYRLSDFWGLRTQLLHETANVDCGGGYLNRTEVTFDVKGSDGYLTMQDSEKLIESYIKSITTIKRINMT